MDHLIYCGVPGRIQNERLRRLGGANAASGGAMSKQRTKGLDRPPTGFSRRGFLTSVGAGAIGATVIGTEGAVAAPAVAPAGDLVPLALLVNGRKLRLMVEPRETLLVVLRERIGLTGTKPGCERGECGACTVLIDGTARYACLTLALEADGRSITTVEGLLEGEKLGAVQQAFVEEDGFQCGYCTPGQVMAAEGLLRTNSDPSLPEICRGMSGNLCRCGAYPHIFKAVERAGELKRKGGGR
jgi:xanthine dehydrogenase YagT iron-sulfur-binding subunit